MSDLELDFTYDKDCKFSQEYLNSLPDLQNGPANLIKGAKVSIQQVGVHNFKLPLTFRKKDGGTILLETSVTGTVSLEGQKKGINMSRITRSFYEFQNEIFSLDILENILTSYKKQLGSFDAKIVLKFSYPILKHSLRSNLEGWQFYNVALEGHLNRDGEFEEFIHFDFIYSSACPCSFELGMHACATRNKAFISHSQRSIARISIKIKKNNFIWIEDLRDWCLEALKTETQVLVKRQDEQAFAELNAAYQKFVEDALRLLFEQLDKKEEVADFRIICSHMESLHNSNAVGVIVKGITKGFQSNIDFSIFNDLITLK
jgi:GTP cyclohydrolase I